MTNMKVDDADGGVDAMGGATSYDHADADDDVYDDNGGGAKNDKENDGGGNYDDGGNQHGATSDEAACYQPSGHESSSHRSTDDYRGVVCELRRSEGRREGPSPARSAGL